MFCHKCGTQIIEDSAFCPKCGEMLIKDKADPQASFAPEGEASSFTNAANPVLTRPRLRMGHLLIGIAVAVVLIIVVIVAIGSSNGVDGNAEPMAEALLDTSNVASQSSPDESDAGSLTAAEAQQLVEEWMATSPLVGEEDVIDPEYYSEDYGGDGYYGFPIVDHWEGVQSAGAIVLTIVLVDKSTGEMLSYDHHSEEIITLDDWSNQALAEIEAEEEDYSDYQMPEMDENLIGRWRSADGSILELDAEGNFRVPWQIYIAEIDSGYWETNNGRLYINFSVTSEREWTQFNSKGEYDEDYLHLIGSYNLRRAEWDDWGSGLTGIWLETAFGSVAHTLYEDGTGYNGETPMRWRSDDTSIWFSEDRVSWVDYSVMGDSLTIYFSEGSEYFTRVGY